MGLNRSGRPGGRSTDGDPDTQVIVTCSATPEQLGLVHEALTSFWRGVKLEPPDQWKMLFELAISEIAANIVEHARPPVMTLRLSAHRGRVVAEFSDGGRGWAGPPEPSDFIDALAERGRGLSLASTAVDEVTYSRDGSINRWRLVKKL